MQGIEAPRRTRLPRGILPRLPPGCALPPVALTHLFNKTLNKVLSTNLLPYSPLSRSQQPTPRSSVNKSFTSTSPLVNQLHQVLSTNISLTLPPGSHNNQPTTRIHAQTLSSTKLRHHAANSQLPQPADSCELEKQKQKQKLTKELNLQSPKLTDLYNQPTKTTKCDQPAPLNPHSPDTNPPNSAREKSKTAPSGLLPQSQHKCKRKPSKPSLRLLL